MELEQIFPGIYLTLCEDGWTADKLRAHGFTHIIRIDKHMRRNASTNNKESQTTNPIASDHDQFSPQLDGFETLDLNFGETSYLTTVLPNCYKGVRFIDNALKHGGSVLIVDRITNEKCITVVVGFLMYKDNLKFSTAFQLVKQNHPNIELDRYYENQMYEYEPILQVQRTINLYGNSCSRELRSSVYKRKISHEEPSFSLDESWNSFSNDNSDTIME
ncbi:Serine/threonine/tyrosine-interacting protein [Pseudolycoriella hygida]|uniref:Serine/threonine/tyrosine-interacting protein n=1 Tax=Pseudolycoriella hygida TaxID=35572 RepID=A0A9Q0MR58_9DIPT|nr:Serine/threonine/tyrosine-interacting protein [Pseudolycoriella hygida]